MSWDPVQTLPINENFPENSIKEFGIVKLLYLSIIHVWLYLIHHSFQMQEQRRESKFPIPVADVAITPLSSADTSPLQQSTELSQASSPSDWVVLSSPPGDSTRSHSDTEEPILHLRPFPTQHIRFEDTTTSLCMGYSDIPEWKILGRNHLPRQLKDSKEASKGLAIGTTLLFRCLFTDFIREFPVSVSSGGDSHSSLQAKK